MSATFSQQTAELLPNFDESTGSPKIVARVLSRRTKTIEEI